MDYLVRKNIKNVETLKYESAHFDDEGKLLDYKARWPMLAKRLNIVSKDSTIETIIIDGLTGLVEMALDEVRRVTAITGDGNAPRIAEGPKNGDFFPENKAAQTIAGAYRIQDWGSFLDFMRKFFSALRDTGKFIVVNAHLDLDKPEGTSIFQHFIRVPSSFKNEIAGMFTDCWLLDKEETSVMTVASPGNPAVSKRQYVVMITTVPIPGYKACGFKSGLGLENTQVCDFEKISALVRKAKPIVTPSP